MPKAAPEQTAAEEITERVNEALETVEEPGEVQAEPGKPKTEEEPKPETVTIDGQEYALEDVRKWKSGHLMESDYTRKTQALAQERRALEQRESALGQLLEKYETALKSFTPADPAAEEIEIDPRAKRLFDERDRKIAAAMQQIEELRGSITEREQTERQDRINHEIVTVADETLRSLLKDKKVPEDQIELYRDLIAMRDPDCADPITGELSKQSIADAIRREFAPVHQRLAKSMGAATSPTLKKEPPARPAGKPAPAAKASPNARPKDAFDGSREHFMDRLNAAMSSGGGEDY